MLTKEDLAKFRAKLEAGQKKLEEEIKKLETPVDFGSDIESTFDEEADEAEEFSANAGKAQELKIRYQDTIDAINKIDRGQYGLCERCKQPIEKEILEIDPESRFCKADKSNR